MNFNKTIITLSAAATMLILTTQCSESSNTKTEADNSKDTTAQISTDQSNSGGMKIAWVNGDSLTANYNLANKLKETLMSEQSLAEAELEKLYSKFEKKQAALEKEAPILGQNELNKKAGELQQLQQQIMQTEQMLQQGLASKEMQATNSYISLTNEFIQKIGKDLGYDYIISFQAGGQLMYGAAEHDITAEVLKRLNDAYAQHESGE